MTDRFVNIHTHRPTGRGIELCTAGVHPWEADRLYPDTVQSGSGFGSDAAFKTDSGAIQKTESGTSFYPTDPSAHSGTCVSLPQLPEGIQAVGEIGLDRVRGAAFDRQLEVFRAQLAQAHERRLPVVIHCVRAFEEVMRELAACEPRAVILHGFVGSPEQARRAIANGYYLSYGERTFASPKTLAALRTTPLEWFFAETDESETPIGDIYTRLAAARGVQVAELQRATYENYERIFKIHHG